MPTVSAIRVETPRGDYRFSCVIHETDNENKRLLGREFYRQFNHGKVPKGIHHELELVYVNEDDEIVKKLHIHVHKGRCFICWPKAIPDRGSALMTFIVWCVGSAYTLIHDKDFDRIFTELKANHQDFLRYMKEKFEIEIYNGKYNSRSK